MPTSSEDRRSGNPGVTDGEEYLEGFSLELTHDLDARLCNCNELHGQIEYFI